MKQLLVDADLKNIGLIEEFIHTSKDIPAGKRSAALIIATEIFDNISEHAVLTENTGIRLAVSDIFFPRLCFSYCSTNFDKLLRALERIKPYFDPKTKRYRGFGLLMAKNLSRRITCEQYADRSYIVVYL